jgi:hypothetical protein
MNNVIKNIIMKNNVASNDRTNVDITIRKKSLRTIPDSSLLDNVENPRSMKNLTSSTLDLTRLNYELEGYEELELEALDDLSTKYLEIE